MARRHRKYNKTAVRRAYFYFRGIGLSPADALRCARAERWAWHVGADAFTFEDFDQCEREPVLTAVAGFMRGAHQEFTDRAPSAAMSFTPSTDERWATAEALFALRAIV